MLPLPCACMTRTSSPLSMTFGEKVRGQLSRKAEALSLPACAVKGLKRERARVQPNSLPHKTMRCRPRRMRPSDASTSVSLAPA
jgi:hypothetical protein